MAPGGVIRTFANSQDLRRFSLFFALIVHVHSNVFRRFQVVLPTYASGPQTVSNPVGLLRASGLGLSHLSVGDRLKIDFRQLFFNVC